MLFYSVSQGWSRISGLIRYRHYRTYIVQRIVAYQEAGYTRLTLENAPKPHQPPAAADQEN